MTRDLDAAKWWVRNRARGGELFGILASSRAKRLKPFGINVNAKISPAEWFLNGPQDVRSCHYLEDVGSEFEIQGLELDWCCIGWDADLRYSNGAWDYFTFRGTQWKSIRQEDRQRFLQNTYRVLLTRARQGFVIFLPPGSAEDFTRNPAYYDGTYEYLHSCGIPIIDVANLSPNE